MPLATAWSRLCHLPSTFPVSPVIELQAAIDPSENIRARSYLNSQISETFLPASKKAQTVFHGCGSCLLQTVPIFLPQPLPTSLTQGALVINLSVAYICQTPWSYLRAFVLSGSSLLNAFPGHQNGSFSLYLGPCVILSECAVLTPLCLIASLPQLYFLILCIMHHVFICLPV